ncbi:uncharacterized protein LOC120839199 [Ixodes scapularis]|uniref:uncharacterized protein LOC120839199 n=1 Tax=Ixodes scapularis TaxID=6945 RepID=UPI001A9DB9B2|nr:uncharacterized protein LOC120839199 [Ixodes scapularis]
MRSIVLWALIALGGVPLLIGAANQRHHYEVSFDNGTCKYRNQTLDDGGFLTLQFPCELWLCNATEKTLTVEGCNVRRYGSCIHVHKYSRYWPFCCPGRPIC